MGWLVPYLWILFVVLQFLCVCFFVVVVVVMPSISAWSQGCCCAFGPECSFGLLRPGGVHCFAAWTSLMLWFQVNTRQLCTRNAEKWRPKASEKQYGFPWHFPLNKIHCIDYIQNMFVDYLCLFPSYFHGLFGGFPTKPFPDPSDLPSASPAPPAPTAVARGRRRRPQRRDPRDCPGDGVGG